MIYFRPLLLAGNGSVPLCDGRFIPPDILGKYQRNAGEGENETDLWVERRSSSSRGYHVARGGSLLRIFFSILLVGVLCLDCAVLHGEEITLPRELVKGYDLALKSGAAGNLEEFKIDVNRYRNSLYRRGLYSINSFVDDLFGCSGSLEKGKREAMIREALKISPLNVKYWLYLSLSDLLGIRLFRCVSDLLNLYYGSVNNPVSLLKSLYVLSAVFIFFLLSFAFFFALAMVFKYISSLAADITRVKSLDRLKIYVKPALLVLLFLLSVLVRSPFTLLMVFLILFSPYMVHREIVITYLLASGIIVAILLNGGLGGNYEMTISPGSKNLLYLSYGILENTEPGVVDLLGDSLLHQVGRVRYALLKGKYREVVSRSRKLEKKFGKEYGSFEALGLFYGGDTKGAIKAMEKVKRDGGDDPVTRFNLYQIYTGSFRFEKGSQVMEKAWKEISSTRPYSIDPSSIESKVLIPPSANEDLFNFLTLHTERGEGEKGPFSFLWKPPVGTPLPFFVYIIVATILLRVVTYNRYITLACRICGDRQLWKVSMKKDDICPLCRSKSLLVRGSSWNGEKLYPLRFRKKALRVLSLLVPGYPFISAGSVTTFFLINGVFSFFLSLFVLFHYLFPGDFSPLYGMIGRLGSLVTGTFIIFSYCATTVSGEFYLRKLHRKYNLKEL